jgi:hypothetical protein
VAGESGGPERIVARSTKREEGEKKRREGEKKQTNKRGIYIE